MISITSINTIKIYYPFLWDRGSGSWTSLRLNNHKKYIAYFSLFADQIIIPPRDLLGNFNAKENLEFLAKDAIANALIKNEFLVTTSGKREARDFKDVCELYGNNTLISSLLPIDMATYMRDEELQRSSYAKFFIKEIERRGLVRESGIEELISRNPAHTEVIRYINAADYSRIIKSILTMQANFAYHYGGAVGNDAIVPPYRRQDRPPAYNPFYYFSFIEKFGSRLEKKIGVPLELNPQFIIELSRELYHFKKSYYDFSMRYLSLAEEIERLVYANDMSRRLYFDAISAITDTLLSSVWSMINILPAKLGLKYIGDFFYTYISKEFRPSDFLAEKIWSVLRKYSPMISAKYDLIDLLNNFDKAVVNANKSLQRTQ